MISGKKPSIYLYILGRKDFLYQPDIRAEITSDGSFSDGAEVKNDTFTMKSLILAQDER